MIKLYKLPTKLSRVTSFLLVSLLLCCCFITNTFAINNPLKFNILDTKDGLSQSYVFDIIQDDDNFIWIATEDGLNRYDGSNFVQYRHNVNDPHSLVHNATRKLFIDDQGVLWIGTEKGLSRYNKKLDNFDNFVTQDYQPNALMDNRIWAIYQDHTKDQNLWIATSAGLHIFNKKEQSFVAQNIQGMEQNRSEIKTIYQDKKGNFWFGTYDNGIYLSNSSRSYAVSLAKPNNRYQLTLNVNALNDIRYFDDQYWLATDNGVYVINENYQIIQHYQKDNTDKSLLSNTVRSLAVSANNQVWLATANGLNVIDIPTGKVRAHQASSHPKAINNNKLLTIYQDHQQRLWLGSLGGGIALYNPLSQLFQHYLYNRNAEITSLLNTEKSKIWVATSKGDLRLFDFTSSPNSIHEYKSKNRIYNLLTEKNNAIYSLTSERELYVIEPLKNIETRLANWQVKNADFYSYYLAKNNQLWFKNSKGQLSAFKLINNSYKSFKNINVKSLLHSSHDFELYLISPKNELVRINTNSNEITILRVLPKEISSNSLISILINKNTIWFGSQSQGIIKLENNQLSYFNESNGLKNNFINGLLLDDDNNLWCSTNKGISVITAEKNEIINFYEDYQLNDNEFLTGSNLKTPTGLMLFGGLNGFTLFNPANVLKVQQQIPMPVLTQVTIANKALALASKQHPSPLTQQINQLRELSLAYNQSPITFSFISPNAKQPEQIRYQYRLQGLEDDWLDADPTNLRATYTNLSHGHYQFLVRAFDARFPDQFQQKSLNLTIAPPWWLSPLAILIYAILLLLFIGYILLQAHQRRLFHQQIRQSEERLKLSLWGSGDEMWDWHINTGKIYRSNIWGTLDFPQDGTREKLLTLPETENSQTKQVSNIHPLDLSRVQATLNQNFTEDNQQFEETYRVKGRNGRWIWVLDRGKVVERDANGKALRMTGTLKDITQIKKAEEKLKLFARCIENISDAVVIYDRAFNTIEMNKAFHRMSGFTRQQVIGKPLHFSQYPARFTDAIKKHLLKQNAWTGELDLQKADGSVYRCEMNLDIIRNENHQITHFVSTFSDISERKKSEEELRSLANSDTLTGLPNRSYFQADQAHLVQQKAPHALLVFDLDNFKKINDSLGHEVGDSLLCQVADRISHITRSQDTVCRLGGDEFSLLVKNTNDIHTITSQAKAILAAIAKPMRARNQEVVLYSSIGIVLYPEDGQSPQELLKNADTAMYHAKNQGGNRYQFFNDSMNSQAVKRLQVESLIRYGIRANCFEVYYQPKIEIKSGKVAGMEALVRFEHPKKGLVPPNVFIPVSEETGQIVQIGELVLRQACIDTKKWVDAGLFTGRVAVNLSAVQFSQPKLVEMIARVLQQTQLPARYLELEITEGTVMNSPKEAIELMLQIRAMGIHLSLDDFGTGYSSLAYLKKFPLNTLKIDKAFVDDIDSSEQGRNMVTTIITIAHNLGLHVVAEGVEHESQLNFLAKQQCEQLQGYLYAKPLPANDFQKYIVSQQITAKSTTFIQS